MTITMLDGVGAHFVALFYPPSNTLGRSGREPPHTEIPSLLAKTAIVLDFPRGRRSTHTRVSVFPVLGTQTLQVSCQ
jgi:hypothetical protein